jgi:hypothetical protein
MHNLLIYIGFVLNTKNKLIMIKMTISVLGRVS